MKKMGKYELKDELNCGVCGYNTCREKAQAVFEGMAETNMCLHYMRTKAESLANEIVENTASNINFARWRNECTRDKSSCQGYI